MRSRPRNKRVILGGGGVVRIDLSSAVVVGLAVASSLALAWWLGNQGQPGPASPDLNVAAVMQPVAGSTASETHTPTQLVRGRDGHWWAEARISGPRQADSRAVRALVDTGASLVVLTPADAQRLGLNLSDADYDDTVVTAAGPARAARVTLGSVSVAGASVDNVAAIVVHEGLPHSLLGMSFLSRLEGWQVSGDVLTLRP